MHVENQLKHRRARECSFPFRARERVSSYYFKRPAFRHNNLLPLHNFFHLQTYIVLSPCLFSQSYVKASGIPEILHLSVLSILHPALLANRAFADSMVVVR